VSDSPWYLNGLRFSCSRCGNCCGGGPGTIRATDEEIGAIAQRLGLGDADFRARYTRRLRNGDLSLTEKTNHDCVFYDRGSGCNIYSDRPKQCQTWPFWQSVVFSPETWDEEAQECPGMNTGAQHAPDTIRAIAHDDGTSHSHRRPALR
jgi:Fe-S-cluster containining protein